MPTYRLHYFDARGRGEGIRFLFAVSGQKYEDKRYTRAEWNLFKPSVALYKLNSAQWMPMKDFIKENMKNEIKWSCTSYFSKNQTPFGQMPVLEIDGKLYGQSGAIGHYLARSFGLYGKSSIDALNIDIVVDCSKDFVIQYVVAVDEKDEERKKGLMARLTSEVIPNYISQTENLLGPSGYFVGDSMTYADIYLYDIVDNILRLKEDAITNSPKLLNNRKLVESNPRLSNYLKSRT